MVEQKSGNRFDKLINYSQIRLGQVVVSHPTLERRPSLLGSGDPFKQELDNFQKFVYTKGEDEGEDLYKLVINTVGYIYCIEPSGKNIRWVLNKKYYYKISDSKDPRDLSLSFYFQDARNSQSREEKIIFYTPSDKKTFKEFTAEKV
jgi:hypothetical protein